MVHISLKKIQGGALIEYGLHWFFLFMFLLLPVGKRYTCLQHSFAALILARLREPFPHFEGFSCLCPGSEATKGSAERTDPKVTALRHAGQRRGKERIVEKFVCGLPSVGCELFIAIAHPFEQRCPLPFCYHLWLSSAYCSSVVLHVKL